MVANATLDTVYETLTHDKVNANFYPNAAPSIEVKGGTVNIYGSNEDSQPANTAAMTLLQDSPFAEGLHNLNSSFKWVLFELDTSSPVVKTNNCIKV